MSQVLVRNVVTCTREHTISCGHRVHGHESKCANFHGHNYTIRITCAAPQLDAVGRVIDFSQIKAICCEWLEREWDHKFLLWKDDPWAWESMGLTGDHPLHTALPGMVLVDFNPTAENMATFLVSQFNLLLDAFQIRCTAVEVQETPKCSAKAEQYILSNLPLAPEQR